MFIDIHGHAYKRPYPGWGGKPVFSTPEQLLVKYERFGIEKAALLPLVSPEVYLPQSNEEILEITEKYPDRFIPFCNIDPRAVTNTANAPLGYLLEHYKNCGCKGIGEVMPNIPFLHPMALNLFHHVEKAGLPLIFDITTRVGGAYGLYDDQGLPQFEQCLRMFPKLKFLGHGPPFWAEIAELETPADRSTYPMYPVKKEGVVPKLLRRYPNLYGDLSAGSGYIALARDPEYAARFLTEFQDKLFFGTDICGNDQDPLLPGFLISLVEKGKITETAFRKIARENTIKLLNL